MKTNHFQEYNEMKSSIENEVLDQIIELGERQEQVKSTLKRNTRWKRFLIWCKKTLWTNYKNYWSYNSKTEERQSFWDRKSYLKKQRKQKKPLQLPKDFEDISERYTKINQAYEQEKYRNKRPIGEEFKKKLFNQTVFM